MERSALLRRHAFFSCGLRHVAHCMHRVGRGFFDAADPARARAGCAHPKKYCKGFKSFL